MLSGGLRQNNKDKIFKKNKLLTKTKMDTKNSKAKKLGIIIGAILVVAVAGVAIWGGTSGWFQGSLQNYGAGTSERIKVIVTYMKNTGGGKVLDNLIYQDFTPKQYDPVWCIMVENKGTSWIEMSKLVFSKSFSSANKNNAERGIVNYTDSNRYMGAILINFPYLSSLARLYKSDLQAAPSQISIIADRSQNQGSYKHYFSFNSSGGVDPESTRILAGQTGYFCLLNNSQDFLHNTSSNVKYIWGGARLSELNFKDQSGNSILSNQIKFVHPEYQQNKIKYRVP